MMENYSLSDIAAVTDGNNNNGWGGNFGEWILVFLIFAIFGNGFGYGGFGGGNRGGVSDGYVLASDFANIERKIDGVNNGLCDGFYAQNTNMLNGFSGVQNTLTQGFAGINTAIVQQGYEDRMGQNGLMTAIKDCCCQTQQNIKDTQYGVATTGAGIQAAIKDCCCENEKAIMGINYNMATQNCQTLQAIDKVGDRIIDFMCQEKTQALRDENQALRLAASQAAQNNYLISQLNPCPIPAYITCNPHAPLQTSGCGCC